MTRQLTDAERRLAEATLAKFGRARMAAFAHGARELTTLQRQLAALDGRIAAHAAARPALAAGASRPQRRAAAAWATTEQRLAARRAALLARVVALVERDGEIHDFMQQEEEAQ